MERNPENYKTGGFYTVIVTEPLGASSQFYADLLLSVKKINAHFPMSVIRKVAKNVLLGLQHLHEDICFIHHGRKFFFLIS